jgi:hypothetical protein
LVALASVAGIVATRSWGRTVVAALAVASGAAAAAVAVWFAARSSAVIAEHAAAASGGATPTITSATPAWALALVAGLVVVGAGGWTAVRGRRWPSLGTRYERAPRGERAPSAWEAQDLGRDPTDDLVTGPDPDAETDTTPHR